MSLCICFFLIAVLLSRQAPCGLDAALIVVVIWLISHVWLFCNLMDCSLPGSSVHGISQARVLEWVAISFSRGSSWLTQGYNPHLLHCRQILYPWVTGEVLLYKFWKMYTIQYPPRSWYKTLSSLPDFACTPMQTLATSGLFSLTTVFLF